MTALIPSDRDTDPSRFAGYRTHRTVRSTGATVVLLDAFEQGLYTQPDRWMLSCERHAELSLFRRQATARKFLPHPEQWCGGCRDDYYHGGEA